MKRKIIYLLLILAATTIAFLLVKAPVSRFLNSKGLTYYQNSNFSQASKLFELSLFFERRNKVALINTIKTYILLDERVKAKTLLNRLNTIDSTHAEIFALQGQILTIEKKYSEAMPFLNQAIKRDSLLSYAFYYRGIALANMNDLEGAANDYNKAHKLDEYNISLKKNSDIAYSQLDNFESSIDNYDKLLSLNSTNALAFYQRGTFKMNIGDFSGAIRDFNKALTLKEDDASTHYNRGLSYAKTGGFKQAVDDFKFAAIHKFKIPGAYYNTGLAYLKLNKTREAKEYLLKTIQYNEPVENTCDAYHLLGIIEMMDQKYNLAIDYFNKSITGNAEFADAYYNRAIAYGLINEHHHALADLNKCISLGKKSADVFFALGIQKISLHDYSNGCADLTKAMNMGYAQAVELKKMYCK